jgi:DNA repair protein RadC
MQENNICHNHPSGKVKPSDNDIKLTAEIIHGANTLKIKLVDHIIICDTKEYYSMLDDDFPQDKQ